MRSRLLPLAVAALLLGVGLGIGMRLSGSLAPSAPAIAAPPGQTLAPSADFAAIARQATPAVVNISALQVFRSERSPFFSDPFFREFFGRDRTSRSERGRGDGLRGRLE